MNICVNSCICDVSEIRETYKVLKR